MIRILQLEKEHSLEDIFFAMKWSLEHKTFSCDAIKLTLKEMNKKIVPIEPIHKEYPKVEVESVNLVKYDQLIGGTEL